MSRTATNHQPKVETILHRTKKLFWERGFRDTTMRDIGKACGCKPSNIYNYFPNKEELLYRIIYDDTGGLVAAIRHLDGATGTSPFEQMRELVRIHLHLVLGSGRAARLIFDQEMRALPPARLRKIMDLRDEYDRILQGILQRGMDSGVFAKVDIKLTSYCIAAQIIRVRMWYSPRGRLSRQAIIDGISQLILDGLTVRVPIKSG